MVAFGGGKDEETLRQADFKESWMGDVREHHYDIKQVMDTAQARQVNSLFRKKDVLVPSGVL